MRSTVSFIGRIIRWHTASMPELPDVTVYVEQLAARAVGQPLRRLQLLNPFVLRTAVPPIGSAEGRRVAGVERLGKRVVLCLEGELFLVLHLMIAGRLRWLAPGARTPGRIALARFDFDAGSLLFTEAGSQRRASLHLVQGRTALAALDAGGIDPLHCDLAAFCQRLQGENHTLKRALTDPRLFSGIGNAYSDEILHRAQLSPLALSRALDADAQRRLYEACRTVLGEWTARLRDEAVRAGGWPDKVTAFHPQMAVHGRYREPCPVCASPVQRIVYASNECNYCARCQTGGRLLADRALSKLLKASWPKHIDDLG
jgi:formamidopyrimidine-DNA glycosylase